MFELFNDTFKIWFQFQGQGQIQGQIRKIVKKCLFYKFVLLLYQS